ncbi:MAG: DnaD domain protein [Clostridia bacterium]|nr:DnaD domain protein [Clostridia bacterium]
MEYEKQKQEKKKYWLKLDKDFLKSSQMKVLKNMPNGKDYIIFYLSLMLESVETVGHLRFTSLVPYNDEMLSAITDTNIDLVRSAVKLFCELGLMQIFDDGTIFMPDVPKMTGKECESAERVRNYREKLKNQKDIKLLQCNNDVTKSNDNKEKEEEKEKDKEKNKQQQKDKEKEVVSVGDSCVNGLLVKANDSCANDLQEIIDFYNNNIGLITPYGTEILSDYLKEMDKELIILAMKKSIEANIRTIKYIKGILNNWNKKGIKTLIEAEKEDKNFEKNKEIKNQKVQSFEQREYADLSFLYANLNTEGVNNDSRTNK